MEKGGTELPKIHDKITNTIKFNYILNDNDMGLKMFTIIIELWLLIV